MKKAGVFGNLSTAAQRRPALREDAETLAANVLLFLATDVERLQRFAQISGLGLENLRSVADSPAFLSGVLDYLAGDESLLLAFAANAGIDPSEIERARAALSTPTAE